MKKDDLQALVGHRVAEIQYNDDETIAYIVVDEGTGYEVEVKDE